jgi:ATP/maltotriose-dependent transcriptional regulator MalT
VASLILADLADVPEDVLVVLDDYHLIHNREIHKYGVFAGCLFVLWQLHW